MAPERDEHAGGELAGATQSAAAVNYDVVPLFQVLDYVLHEGLEILRLGLWGTPMSSMANRSMSMHPIWSLSRSSGIR